MSEKKDIGPFNPPRPEEKWRRIRKDMEAFKDRLNRTLPYTVQNFTLTLPDDVAKGLISIGFDMGQESRQAEIDRLKAENEAALKEILRLQALATVAKSPSKE